MRERSVGVLDLTRWFAAPEIDEAEFGHVRAAECVGGVVVQRKSRCIRERLAGSQDQGLEVEVPRWVGVNGGVDAGGREFLAVPEGEDGLDDCDG